MSCRTWLVTVFAVAATVPALADGPVEFDSRRSFPCQEVKPPDRADADRKVIVVVIPISANFNVEEKTIESLRYELKMPRGVTIIDHLPKTQTGTNVVGAQREQRHERTATELNVQYGGQARSEFNLWGARFSVGGGGGVDKRQANEVVTDIKVDRLPAREQVIVAGTRDEGQTLYFTLKWFDQTTREGLTDYALLAEVPKDWTGDCFTLDCTARQNGGVVSQMRKVVGLYVSGNNAARARVEEKARTTLPAATSDDLKLITNSLGMRLKLIPAGTFLMGAAPDEKDAEDDEKPQHRVTLTRSFYMGVCEVTQHEYRALMGENPSHFQDSDQLPVERVSWFDAVKACNALSKKEGLKPFYAIDGDWATVPDWDGEGYRLPTEAEWEYACRAGKATRYWFGDDEDQLGQHAWFFKNSEDKTRPVGYRGTENPFGLCDMLGNVWEWCWDWNDEEYYKNTINVDPTGPNAGKSRVFRGGGWNCGAKYFRSAYRDRDAPSFRDDFIGLRFARTYH